MFIQLVQVVVVPEHVLQFVSQGVHSFGVDVLFVIVVLSQVELQALFVK